MVTTPARVRRLKPRPRMDVLLTTIFAAAAATALLYVTTLSVPQALGPLHYFVLLPVALAAYRKARIPARPGHGRILQQPSSSSSSPGNG